MVLSLVSLRSGNVWRWRLGHGRFGGLLTRRFELRGQREDLERLGAKGFNDELLKGASHSASPLRVVYFHLMTMRNPRFLGAALVCGVTALFFLFFARDCHAQEAPTALKPLAAIFAAAAATDVTLTRLAIRAGRGHEANPLYRGGTLRMVAIKSAITGSAIAYAWRARTTHPKRAVWLLVAATASQIAVDAHNYRVLRHR